MSISKKDIQKLSELARIEVSDTEADSLQHDLERILAYVEQLNRAETGSIEPIYNMSFQENSMRDDDPEQNNIEADSSELMDAAPRKHANFVKVPSVWKR